MRTFKGIVFSYAFLLLMSINQASAAPLNAYWVQGTFASLQTPAKGITLNKLGWGAVYTVPSALSGSIAAWGHIALPTPVIVNNVRSTLSQVLVQYNGTAKIDQVDVWDGPNRIASISVNWSGDHTAFGNWGVVTIPGTHSVLYGIGISFHVTNNCLAGTTCPKQSMNVVSAGGDFFD